MISGNTESRGPVINVEHNAVEFRMRVSQNAAYILVYQADARIIQRVGGEIVRAIPVPGDDLRRYFGDDYRGVRVHNLQRCFQGKSEPQSTNQHPRTGIIPDMRTSKFGKLLFGGVLSGGHELRPADSDSVTAVMLMK